MRDVIQVQGSKNIRDTYLGQQKICIRVLDNRRHAIAIQRKEFGLLQLGREVDLGRVGHMKLFEKDRDLPWIRPSYYPSAGEIWD